MQCCSNLPPVSHSSETTTSKKVPSRHLPSTKVWGEASVVLIKVNGWEKGGMGHWYSHLIRVLPPWRGAYRGLLVPAARAKALCVKESITFQPCKGLQQMSALHIVESLSLLHTLTHTPSALEVLSVKSGYFVSLSTFDCRFHGGPVKLGGFDTKKYNKQRKLETRQTFWVTANTQRHASQEDSASADWRWKCIQ